MLMIKVYVFSFVYFTLFIYLFICLFIYFFFFYLFAEDEIPLMLGNVTDDETLITA